MNWRTQCAHERFPHLRSVLKSTSGDGTWYSSDRGVDPLIIAGAQGHWFRGRIDKIGWVLWFGHPPAIPRTPVVEIDFNRDGSIFHGMIQVRSGWLRATPENRVVLLTDYQLNPLVFETDFREVNRMLTEHA